jgi:hypothetical protein
VGCSKGIDYAHSLVEQIMAHLSTAARLAWLGLFVTIETAGHIDRVAAQPPLLPGGDAEAKALLNAADLSPAIRAIFKADQTDRSTNPPKDIFERDAARRSESNMLIRNDQLKTGSDYEAAAFIFQHGSKAEDYLKAHVLAITALAKGDTRAGWIAAATLDRYLMVSEMSQIYGTQFKVIAGRVSQDPFNKTIMSDKMRADANVLSIAEQERAGADLQARITADSAH